MAGGALIGRGGRRRGFCW